MSNDISPDKPSNPMERFTQAVKTIVNVPKSMTPKKIKTIVGKTGIEYNVYKCPKCGKEFIVTDGKKHKHGKPGS